MQIRPGATFVPDRLRAVGKWQSFAGEAALPPWIVYGGDNSRTRKGFRVFAWQDVPEAAREHR